MLCAERPAPVLKDINRERACDSECVCVCEGSVFSLHGEIQPQCR